MVQEKMKLFWSANSPYVRKVLVALCESDLEDQVVCISAGDFILTGVGPSPITTSLEHLDKYNPSARIPTLVLADESTTFFGSQAIEHYIASVAPKGRLYGSRDEERLQNIQLESVADGLLDAALQLRYETTIRPEELRWDKWAIGWKSKMLRTLEALSPNAKKWHLPDPQVEHLGIGGIAVASALWYLNARFPDIDWYKDEELSKWYDEVTQRASWQRALELKPHE